MHLTVLRPSRIERIQVGMVRSATNAVAGRVGRRSLGKVLRTDIVVDQPRRFNFRWQAVSVRALMLGDKVTDATRHQRLMRKSTWGHRAIAVQ